MQCTDLWIKNTNIKTTMTREDILNQKPIAQSMQDKTKVKRESTWIAIVTLVGDIRLQSIWIHNLKSVRKPES